MSCLCWRGSEFGVLDWGENSLVFISGIGLSFNRKKNWRKDCNEENIRGDLVSWLLVFFFSTTVVLVLFLHALYQPTVSFLSVGGFSISRFCFYICNLV